MCGIAGYYSNKKYNDGVIADQLKAMEHRGPDSSAIIRKNKYVGGMRRLSINDLATGDQPLYNENETIAVLYNGEIYNHKKIREELEGNGHRFRGNSDGEVICHLYEELGENLFEKLDGMFAVALWDNKKEKLILARDIPGEKPLYYSEISGGIAFASEIKSLVKFPDIDLELDYQSIWDLPTFLWIPEPNTIYKKIKALMPGHVMTIDNGGMSIKKYDNSFEKDLILENKSDSEIIEEIRRVVEDSIKSRLLSDVPVGCFLSSGLDSSIIATVASKNLPELSTFTVGFEDIDDPYHGKSDESVYTAEYAKKIGTKHHTIKVNSDFYLKEFDNFCKFGDQPWGVSSGLGVLAVSKAARDAGIKVLLTGDGADECFGGYSWYFHLLNKENKKTIADNESVSFQNFGLPLEERLQILNSYGAHKKAWAWHYYASENEKKEIFNVEQFDRADSSLRWFKQFKGEKEWQPVDNIKHDQAFYLTNEMLKKADLMNMANSVEGRTPFVAPSILNLVKKLPFNTLIRNGQLKWALRQAFSDILPEEITNRPKHGFNHPVDYWLKNDWAHLLEDAFSGDSQISKKGIVNKNSLDIAKKMLNDKNRLNGHTILCYIMLNRWLELNKI